MAFKMHGRLGDSPIIGAGLYVDNNRLALLHRSWGRSNHRYRLSTFGFVRQGKYVKRADVVNNKKVKIKMLVL
jgi:isoaspartyl peptidase/L-asparaginase-like protein (Ntn-hydrolase superfamily)